MFYATKTETERKFTALNVLRLTNEMFWLALKVFANSRNWHMCLVCYEQCSSVSVFLSFKIMKLLVLATRGFSLGTLVFLSPKKPTVTVIFQFQFDLEGVPIISALC